MPKIYPSLPHLNGNLLCTVDLETTGSRPGYHEPIQIAIVPLDSELKPIGRATDWFYRSIKPNFPERAEPDAMRVNRLNLNELCLNALPSEKIEDLLVEWFEKLELPHKRSIIPLAHNWAFESSFLTSWLGVSLKSQVFHPLARDSMLYAASLNDRAHFAGEPIPFNSLSLGSLCSQLHVVNECPHDALHDSLAEAEVYRKLLRFDVF